MAGIPRISLTVNKTMHAYWISRVSPCVEAASRASRLESRNIPLDDKLSRGDLKDIAYQTERIAQLYLWAEIVARVTELESKTAEAVFENTRLSRDRDGKFVITTDPTRIVAQIDELRNRMKEPEG